jgi:hypothetical protein
MDVYVWPTDPEAAEEYTSAASDVNPEVLTLGSPVYSEFYLVVVNFSGANTGYTVSMRYDSVHYDKPTESLEPEAGGSDGSGSSVTPSTRQSGGSNGGPITTTGPITDDGSTTTSSTPEVPGLDLATIGESDLDSIQGGKLEDALAAQGKLAGVKRSGPLPALPDPASWKVLLWLVILPVLAAAILSGIVIRRRPNVLKG